MQTGLGVDIPVFIVSATDLRKILEQHPWEPEKGNQSHVYFCFGTPVIDEALYHDLRTPDEELRVIAGHVHFHAPAGIGRSKLAEKLGKVVPGCEMTGRNLNTVRKLVEMAEC
jgi:uncharacterized protein (DUF1697 family)